MPFKLSQIQNRGAFHSVPLQVEEENNAVESKWTFKTSDLKIEDLESEKVKILKFKIVS